MSNIALNSSATGTGTLTIAAPITNTSRTLTLPDQSGTFLTIDTNGASNVTNLTTTNLVSTTYNGGQLAGMRNKIINGKMDISQRGGSFAAIGSSVYSLDRWLYGKSGAVVHTISQQTDVPSSNEFQNSLRIAVTTADTSIAAGDYSHIIQRIEGYNVRDLIGRTFTLSFWVRSAKTGTHCVAFRNSTADRSYIATYTINTANTWEYKTVTVTGGLITAGTWNWTNGAGLDVSWTISAGSTFHTTAGAWQTGNFLATSAQVNGTDAVNNIFAITGVQLEVGAVATPFEHRPITVELLLCERYYKILQGIVGRIDVTATRAVFATHLLAMRSSPTVLFSGVDQIHEISINSRTITSIELNQLGAQGGYVRVNMSSSGTPGNLCNINGGVFAESEL